MQKDLSSAVDIYTDGTEFNDVSYGTRQEENVRKTKENQKGLYSQHFVISVSHSSKENARLYNLNSILALPICTLPLFSH